MVMIVLSRILSYKSNRLANIIVALIMTIVQVGTLFTADNTMHYIFFGIVEVGTTSFILYSAWNWIESKNIE